MGLNRTIAAYVLTVAALLAVCVSLCRREPAPNRDEPAITDVWSMRIYPSLRTEPVTVFRVTYDGEVVRNVPGNEPAGPTTLRVDLLIDGKPLTVWIREH